MSEESGKRPKRITLSLKNPIMPSLSVEDFESAIRKAESLMEDSLIILGSLTLENGILIRTHSSDVISAFNGLTKEARSARASGKVYVDTSGVHNYEED